MAQYRFSAQIIGRSSGRSAVAAAAYRAGQSMADERTGLIHDYSRRHGVLHAEVIAPDNAPEWMTDRARLWNAVEAAEKRKDSQLAREILLSLPHELDDEQRRELVRGFVREQYTAKGLIADIVIHAPDREGDNRNHHAHIMLTMRELTGAGFGKKERTTAEEKKAALEQEREAWATIQNRTLERYGHAERVDHRSLSAQGIEREPTQHMGPAANAMERRGRETRIGNDNQKVEDRNQARNDNARAMASVRLDIGRLRQEQHKAVADRRAAIEAAQLLDAIELERRQHRQTLAHEIRLDRQYGRDHRQLSHAAEAVSSRLEATGWRRVVRDLTGRSRSDRLQLDGINQTLASIAQRMDEARASLREQHQTERDRQQEAQRQRQEQAARTVAAEYERKRREAVRERREAQRKAIAERAAAEQRRADRPAAMPSLAQMRHSQAKPPSPPTPEAQPMRRDFDKARGLPIANDPRAPEPPRMKHTTTPAPTPSPAGAVYTQPRAAVDVPKVDKVKEWAKTPEGQASLRRDTNTSRPAPENRQPLAPAWATKGRDVAPPEPPSPPQQEREKPAAPSLAPAWATKGREVSRSTPERDRSRDRDFDRDR